MEIPGGTGGCFSDKLLPASVPGLGEIGVKILDF
jgi:hypothetical protein